MRSRKNSPFNFARARVCIARGPTRKNQRKKNLIADSLMPSLWKRSNYSDIDINYIRRFMHSVVLNLIRQLEFDWKISQSQLKHFTWEYAFVWLNFEVDTVHSRQSSVCVCRSFGQFYQLLFHKRTTFYQLLFYKREWKKNYLFYVFFRHTTSKWYVLNIN